MLYNYEYELKDTYVYNYKLRKNEHLPIAHVQSRKP